MDFYEVIRTRRSIRSYKPDPVPDDVLTRILEAARIAPSGSNRQPWKFIVVRDEELKRRLAIACHNQMFIAEAPVVIVACGYNIHWNRGEYMGDLSMLVDVSIAFTHLILAARAEGLGTCWIGSFSNEEVKRILGIPKDVNVVAITPLGYPRDEDFGEPGPRKPLSEIVSFDRF
ncbi:MAG: nitroreductase family protein [Candidatus Bathyarchaeia archaeon]|nr:nitroreductase family protein [Candidatus Bathyarchaeota archaeon]